MQRNQAWLIRWGVWAVAVVVLILSSTVSSAQHSVFFDADADGIEDTFGVDVGFDPDFPKTGSVRVISGATGEPICEVHSPRANDFFGDTVIAIGDCNTDAVPDFLVTAPLSPRALGLGVLYLYSGDDGRMLGIITGLASDLFGLNVHLVDDIDGDGQPDLQIISRFVDMQLNIWELATNHAIAQRGRLWIAPDEHEAVLVQVGADLNQDGAVDAADMVELMLRMGENDPLSDLDSSGVVDPNDAVLLAQQIGSEPPVTPIGRYPWWEFMPPEDFAAWWNDGIGDSGSDGNHDGGGGNQDGGGGDDGGGGGGGDDDDEDYEGDEPEDDAEPEPCEFFNPEDTWSHNDDCYVAIAGPCGQYIGISPSGSEYVLYVAFGWPLHGEYTWSVSGAEEVYPDGAVCVARVTHTGTLRAHVTYTAADCSASALCEARVVRADLDIDSDNNNGFDRPDRNDTEELVEDEPDDEEHPGKVILANTLDFDNDGIPGYADGYDRLTHPDFAIDDEDSTTDFPYAVLGLSKLYCDDALIRITYPASPPLDVQLTLDNPFSLPPGSLRLWRNDSPERDPRPVKEGGHYIAPGEYTREELGLVDGKASRRFYAEVVRPSQAPGDIEILVEYAPRENVGYVASDRVRITGTKVELWGAGFDGAFHPVGGFVKTLSEGVTDPDEDELPEGFTLGAWMLHEVRVTDPRFNLTQQVSIDHRFMELFGDSVKHTDGFMCQSVGYDGPLTDNIFWVFLTGDEVPCEYNPSWVWRVQPELTPPPRSHATLQKLVDEAVAELERRGWRPATNDPGAFGKQVHSDIVDPLRAKRGWYANVIIDVDTREIIKLEGSGTGSGNPTRLEVDAIKCDKGYNLVEGEIFDPSRAQVYEVKCGKDGKVPVTQKEKLALVTRNGRPWERTLSKRVWTADDGGKYINSTKFACAAAAFTVLGGARTAWACIHVDDYDEDLQTVMTYAIKYQQARQDGDVVQMEFEMQDLIEAIRVYVSHFTDHPAVNLVAYWATIDREFGGTFNP